MRRYGPLHVVNGVLLIGDPGRRHLRLLPSALVHKDAAAVRAVAWDEVASVVLELPTTRFRLAGMAAGLVDSALVLVAGDGFGYEVADGRAILHARDGDDAVGLPVSRHHFGAYWDRTVRSAQRLLDRLVADPDSRALLDRPAALLDTVVAATRA